jgi:hypothetical protein
MNPERLAIFESVKRVRDGIDAHRNPSFAQHVHRIPEQDFYVLLRLFPGLSASDPHEKSAAWEAFDKSPLSEPYRVNKHFKGRVLNGNLIK